MAHEQSVTIQVDGKWHNIPSVINGKKVSQAEAKAFAMKNKRLGKSFATVKAAVAAAKARSESFTPKSALPSRGALFP